MAFLTLFSTRTQLVVDLGLNTHHLSSLSYGAIGLSWVECLVKFSLTNLIVYTFIRTHSGLMNLALFVYISKG